MDIVFLALIGAFAALACGMAAGCARLQAGPGTQP
ncbi:hypothetical protein FHS02_001454 [Massilia umbonata]|uniref:Uncharacterized protein n=1 Tax=Pseudoduganella umbonata TaxID=864828 RepID=A0A7W5EAB0_9BURK|nr:hypothetical protein [Pseudoduganella umbonata]